MELDRDSTIVWPHQLHQGCNHITTSYGCQEKGGVFEIQQHAGFGTPSGVCGACCSHRSHSRHALGLLSIG
eukprot:5614346-Amphidinium_carterae.1